MTRATGLRAATLLAALALAACIALGLAVAGALPPGDEIWTAVLLLLSLGLPIWCCFRRANGDGTSRLDVFQPGTVLAGLFYFYTVIPAFHVWRDLGYHSDWTDPTWPPARLFRFTLFLSLLSLVAFRVGYVRRPRRRDGPADAAESGASAVRWPRSATVLALVMLAIGFPFTLAHLAALGGLTPNILLFLSPSYTLESGIQIGGVPTFFEGFFNWGALLLLYRAILTNRQKWLSIAIAGVAFILAYLLSGKRSAIVPFLLYPLVWYHYLKRRLSVERASLYFAVGVTLTAVLLFMRTVGPVLATQGFSVSSVPTDVVLEPVRFYINSPELAGFDMTMLAVEDRSPILHEIGGPFWGALQYNLVGALYIIPRALWPGKPVYRNIGSIFYQHSVGGYYEEVGFTVGIVGGLYLFAELFGVVVGMVLIGVLFRLVYERLQPWNGDPRRVLLYGIFTWMMFHFLRFGDLGGTMVNFYQNELPGVLAALLALKASKPARVAHATIPSRLDALN